MLIKVLLNNNHSKRLTDRPEKLIERLAILEYGIANHCRKMAAELDPNLEPPDPNHTHKSDNPLAWYLFEQYHEERLHGQMLAALIHSPKWDKNGFGKVRIPSQVASRVEGISSKEPFRSLFNGKRAGDLSLGDRLAMMVVLEGYSQEFYSFLAEKDLPIAFRQITKKISLEEYGHKRGLYIQLCHVVGVIKANCLILKWKIKILLAIPKAIEVAKTF